MLGVPTVRQTLVSRREATHKVCHAAGGRGPDRVAGPDPEDGRLGGPTARRGPGAAARAGKALAAPRCSAASLHTGTLTHARPHSHTRTHTTKGSRASRVRRSAGRSRELLLPARACSLTGAPPPARARRSPTALPARSARPRRPQRSSAPPIHTLPSRTPADPARAAVGSGLGSLLSGFNYYASLSS